MWWTILGDEAFFERKDESSHGSTFQAVIFKAPLVIEVGFQAGHLLKERLILDLRSSQLRLDLHQLLHNADNSRVRPSLIVDILG